MLWAHPPLNNAGACKWSIILQMANNQSLEIWKWIDSSILVTFFNWQLCLYENHPLDNAVNELLQWQQIEIWKLALVLQETTKSIRISWNNVPLICLDRTITDDLTRPVCHNLFKPQQISFDTWFWCCWPSCWPSPLSSSQVSVWAELQMDGNGKLQIDINLTQLTSEVSPKKARQNFYSLIIRNSQWPKCYLMIHLVCTAFWRYF